MNAGHMPNVTRARIAGCRDASEGIISACFDAMKAHLAGPFMVTLAILWLLLSLRAHGQEHDPIELRVNQRQCFEPCDIQATVRIEPHPLNRWLVLRIDGPMYVSGMRQLQGETERPTQEPVWFKQLPSGDYLLTAIVYRLQPQSEAGRVSQAVRVIATGGTFAAN